MKTLVYAAPEKVEVREMPVPEPKEGQVRIRVSYCGICGSACKGSPCTGA